MSKQEQIVAQLNAANSALKVANEKITKIGTETDGLNDKVKALQEALANQSNATPELIAATDALGESVTAINEALNVVDAKVPDATPAPEGENNGQ